MKELWKHILAGVIVVVLAAAILGTVTGPQKGWLIRLLGGATQGDVTEAISKQLLRRSAGQSGWIHIPSSQLNVTQSVTFRSEFPDLPAIMLLPSSVQGVSSVSPEFLIEDFDTKGFRFRVLPEDGLMSLQVTWLAVTQTISPPDDRGQIRGSRVAGSAASAPR